MPFLYKNPVNGQEPYILPSFYIDTDTMELYAVQSMNDPVSFSISDEYELITEVSE